MVLRILILFFIIALVSFVLYFLFGIFIPTIKSQTVENSNPLFFDVELNCIENEKENYVYISDKKAVVLCNPNRTFENERLKYNSVKSCKLFTSIYETDADCAFGCVGFGDCVQACPQEAIVIKNNTAVVTSNCCGCGKCVSECPKNLIKLFSKNEIMQNSANIKLCSASENCMTTCSKCSSHNIIEVPEQKRFKFWQACYKILFRK